MSESDSPQLTASNGGTPLVLSREFLAAAIADTLPELLWIADINGTCLYFNRPGAAFFGATAEQLTGSKVLHHPNVEGRVPFPLEQMRREVISTGTPRFRKYVQTRDGTGNTRLLDAALYPIELPIDGKLTRCLLGLARDAIGPLSPDSQVPPDENLLHTVARHAPLVLWACDREGTVTMTAGNGLQRLGMTDAQIRGRSMFRAFKSDEATQRALHRVLSGQPVSWTTSYRGVWYEINAVPLFDTEGHCTGAVGAALDISARKAQEEHILQLAYADPVTQLPNRARFLEWLNEAHASGASGRLAVVHFDIDQFRRINDSFGRDLGDSVLRAAAERLKQLLPARTALAHLGGDHFAALLPSLRDASTVTNIVDEVLDGFRHALMLDAGRFYCTLSAGIALRATDSADDWLSRAEIALDYAKRGGRNRGYLFQESLIDSVREDTRVYLELRQALDQRLLEVHYEPQIRMADRRVVGFEALTRWRHPPLASASVEQTIRVAEESGLIRDITRLVLEQVCQHLQEWRKKLGPQLPRISINVNSAEFVDPSFMRLIDEALGSETITASCLRIELTESSMMERPEAARRVLKNLAQRGVQASLDDFGTGFSSLSLLHELPVDEVKVDRKLLPSPDNMASLSLLRTIMAMAGALRMRTMVEGVETEAQHQLLVGLGCDYGQGFLYSRALDARAACELMQSDRTEF